MILGFWVWALGVGIWNEANLGDEEERRNRNDAGTRGRGRKQGVGMSALCDAGARVYEKTSEQAHAQTVVK